MIGYGGCEIAALPALIFRQRLVVYRPFNAVDAAERSLSGGIGGVIRAAAAVPALVVGVYFLMIRDILEAPQRPAPIPSKAALVLLLPAAALAWNADRRGRRGSWRLDAVARADAVGSFALTATALAFGIWCPATCSGAAC